LVAAVAEQYCIIFPTIADYPEGLTGLNIELIVSSEIVLLEYSPNKKLVYPHFISQIRRKCKRKHALKTYM
jgi:hypothetical protein